jgi:hypothetical protein
MQAISGLGNLLVSIQLAHRGTMTMFNRLHFINPQPLANIGSRGFGDHAQKGRATQREKG